jgi:hypothetical protein
MFTFDDESEHVVWLEAGYTCHGCGCEYRYRFKEKLLADDPDEALGRARRTILRKGLRDIPCPDCGRRTAPIHRSRKTVLAAGLAAMAVFTALLALAVWKVHTLKLFAGAIAGVGATVFAVSYIQWLFWTRNAPSEKRRRIARDLMDHRLIREVRTGAGMSQSPMVGGTRRLAIEAAGPVLGSVILLAVGLGLPSIHSDYNPDVIPGFISPGDEVTYQFPERLQPVKGLWRGQPRFRARSIPESTKPLKIVGEGRTSHWPEEFVLKRGQERVTVFPEVGFRIPFQQELSGKGIDLTILMEVTYPESQGFAQDGGFSYQEKVIDLESHVHLRVASPDQVNLLKSTWWVSAIIAILCLTVPPIVIAANSWRARNARYVLDLRASNSPKLD